MIDEYVVNKYKEMFFEAFPELAKEVEVKATEELVGECLYFSIEQISTRITLSDFKSWLIIAKYLIDEVKKALSEHDSRGVFVTRNNSTDYTILLSRKLSSKDILRIIDLICLFKISIHDYTIKPLKKGEEYYVHVHEGEDEDYGDDTILFAKSEINWF